MRGAEGWLECAHRRATGVVVRRHDTVGGGGRFTGTRSPPPSLSLWRTSSFRSPLRHGRGRRPLHWYTVPAPEFVTMTHFFVLFAAMTRSGAPTASLVHGPGPRVGHYDALLRFVRRHDTAKGRRPLHWYTAPPPSWSLWCTPTTHTY